MEIRNIIEKERNAFNAAVSHPLQSFEWGEFREKTGAKVVRRGFFEKDKLVAGFQLTIHKIPKTPWTIGYLPKGEMPDERLIDELQKIGKQENCIFIQLEPNVIRIKNKESRIKERQELDNTKILETVILDSKFVIRQSAHPLFTRYTFQLDLNKSEEDLLKAMHSKARYNIKVAQKHGVEVVEDNSNEAFEEYLRLTKETTTRQKFYAHTEKYHRDQWQTLSHYISKNNLSSHLLVAKYREKILTAWIVFVFKNSLYYPYGASSSENREVMASNLIMWEVIRFGKKLGLKTFDMWGALGPDPDPKDPWYGFHNFKQKYGPEHVEFVGSYDLVINPILYQLYKAADKLRWFLLRFKK